MNIVGTTRNLFAGVAVLVFAASLSAAAQSADASPADTGRMNSMDSKFAKDAAQGGKSEVELGKLAVKKASSDDVRKFGQRMVDDHDSANAELKQSAAVEGIELPVTLDPKQDELFERLSGLSGRQFDAAYMKAMVDDHKKDVAEFQREASMGHDPALKNFASKALPTLQDHLRMAQQVQAKMQQSTSAETESPDLGK